MHIVSCPALRGASSWDAVKTEQRRGTGRRCGHASPGRPSGEIPPSTDVVPRASGKRNPKRSGDGGAPLAGITTCRQELADRRGWSTFSKARPARRKNAAVERRKARSSASQRRNGTLARRPTGRVSQTAHRGPRKPQRLPALRSPRRETGIAIRNEGLPGADTKNTGDDARLLVIPGRAPKARSRASSRNTREPGIHTPQHQKPNERRAKCFDCGVWIPGPLASLASRNDDGGCQSNSVRGP
jgi:hypothetical protein